jgi:Cdc6-like AAA superfamily ATPase
LYISGSPGTGKTALLKNVLDGLKARQQTEITRIAFLNCTTVTSAGDIWERIAAELELDFTSSPTRGKGKQRCDEARFLDALEKQNGRW